ncbi:MAG: hypothetical protein KDE26_04350 [Bacteroidetes bacterium]|nr:hypothetical protein [Bacteroidota bacterium]MCB0842481.1 hypothetical protein [Bacteroidota bacterium]
MIKSIELILKKNLLRIKLVVHTLIDLITYYLLPAQPLDLKSRDGKKVVLFLGDNLQARIPRMAKWIQRESDYQCYLMVGEGKGYKIFNTEIFQDVFSFRTSWDLKRKLKGLKNVDIIHAFTIPSYQIKLAIDFARAPVIMDMQDMYISYFGLNTPKLYMRLDLPNEAYSIRHAAGLVSQSVELFNACKEYQIKDRPPVLFFPVYADEDYMVTPESVPSMDEIHIVYAGSIAGSFQDNQHFGSMKMFWLIDAFTRQNIHFHIYPSPNMRFGDMILAEYKEIAEKNPFFHVHKSVPQNQLATELSQYHFGLLPFFLVDTSRSANKLGRGSSQKLYNYIEAGIPVIISEDLAFQSWMARRHGAGVEIKKEDIQVIREMIEKLDYAGIRQEILDQRHKIGIGANIPRLIHFYEQARQKFSPSEVKHND